ncbi:histidine phosphatase family protein [Streptomyces hesseae]|uniref:Histidine phosphatase family protein n=1 Tax=Streptomyces hesseae TaxID=3075519 RepID=A0ABU2SLL0_9ACTN|nr:histidine phosphatase family protein [Streptomyces sp. DSM 40473]MDT0449521.1 histidine phosphatase family protein [Streptomyces sp. DSM 40473]
MREPIAPSPYAAVLQWSYRPPGGESLAEVTLRARDLLREMHDSAANRRVMIIAHDAVVVAIRPRPRRPGQPGP